MIKVMKIDGMICAHNGVVVKSALEGLEGVKEAIVNYENGTAVLTLNKKVNDSTLKDAVTGQGYTVIG